MLLVRMTTQKGLEKDRKSGMVKHTRPGSVTTGALALLVARFVYLIGAFLVHSYLGRRLGPIDYGIFGVVTTFLLWIETPLEGGLPFALRKFAAGDSQLMPAIARAALRGQTVFAGAIFALVMLTAPWIAQLLHDPQLTYPLRLASIDIPIYAFYLSYIAILNSSSSYSKQAYGMITYALTKVVLILVLVKLGFGIGGALVGNITASVMGLAAAMKLAGHLEKRGSFPTMKLAAYGQSTALFRTGFALLMGVDLFAVRAITQVGESVGYYAAASTIARSTFYLFVAIGSAVLPAIAQAAACNDSKMVNRHVRQSLRLHMIMLMPLTAIISGTAVGSLNTLYSSRFMPGASALTVLVIGTMVYGFMDALCNALISVGDTKTPIRCVVVSLILAVILNSFLIPQFGVLGAAISSTVTAAIGFLILAILCTRKLGSLVDPISATKIMATSALVLAIGKLLPVHGLQLVGLCFGLVSVYVGILLVLKEITLADLGKARSIILSRGMKKGYLHKNI